MYFFGDSKYATQILLEYYLPNLKKKSKKKNDKEQIKAVDDICSAIKEVHQVRNIYRDLKLISISKFVILIFYALIKHDSKIMNQTQMTETLKYVVNKLVQKRANYKNKSDISKRLQS